MGTFGGSSLLRNVYLIFNTKWKWTEIHSSKGELTLLYDNWSKLTILNEKNLQNENIYAEIHGINENYETYRKDAEMFSLRESAFAFLLLKLKSTFYFRAIILSTRSLIFEIFRNKFILNNCWGIILRVHYTSKQSYYHKITFLCASHFKNIDLLFKFSYFCNSSPLPTPAINSSSFISFRISPS